MDLEILPGRRNNMFELVYVESVVLPAFRQYCKEVYLVA